MGETYQVRPDNLKNELGAQKPGSTSEHAPAREEEDRNHDEERQQNRDGVFEEVGEEARGLHLRLLGDRLHHEVRPVPDVSHGTKEYRSERDGDQFVVMLRDKGLHVGSRVEAQLMPAHRRREEGEVGRRVIEDTGERACEPEELHFRVEAQFAGVNFQVVERRNHGGEDADKQPRDFLDRREVEVVRFVDGFRGEKIRAQRGAHHQGFAEPGWISQEHRDQNHREESHVPQAVELPCFVRGFLVANLFAGAEKIAPVKKVEDRDHSKDRHQPGLPAMFKHPPERYTLEVAQKQRRITNRCEATAHVAHHENEEDDVKCRDAVFVHPNPRANHQHRGAGGSDEVGEHGANKKEQAVDGRRGFAFDPDMNPAGHDEERTNERDEADVFVGDMKHATAVLQKADVVNDRDQTQCHRDLGIVMFPPVFVDEGHHRDGEQQHCKGDDHQRIRIHSTRRREKQLRCPRVEHGRENRRRGIDETSDNGGGALETFPTALSIESHD
jgi:hypothetical protein